MASNHPTQHTQAEEDMKLTGVVGAMKHAGVHLEAASDHNNVTQEEKETGGSGDVKVSSGHLEAASNNNSVTQEDKETGLIGAAKNSGDNPEAASIHNNMSQDSSSGEEGRSEEEGSEIGEDTVEGLLSENQLLRGKIKEQQEKLDEADYHLDNLEEFEMELREHDYSIQSLEESVEGKDGLQGKLSKLEARIATLEQEMQQYRDGRSGGESPGTSNKNLKRKRDSD